MFSLPSPRYILKSLLRFFKFDARWRQVKSHCVYRLPLNRYQLSPTNTVRDQQLEPHFFKSAVSSGRIEQLESYIGSILLLISCEGGRGSCSQ